MNWYTGDCDDELDETAYTVGTPTDDPELLEQFDGTVEDADASASHIGKSQFSRSTLASGSCQECQRLFSCCGVGACDGLDQQSLVAKARRERKIFFSERWKTDKPGYTWHFAKTTDLTF